ncbi:MAG TPA: ribonuclease III [Treponema sp.]|jgi:ribonuclease-3|nr:ribonuclease III [Treponema sp.]HBB43642.1 ribonuclease III [Treponema sp.]HCA19459.1 ribonuclease III [Treponema sp.]
MNLRDKIYESRKLDSQRKKELEAFASHNDLHFHNLNILDLALHHRSFSNENEEHHRYNNERLEFLGDSVLGLATADFLYEDMMDNPEGDLARIKANVVSENSLAPIARNIMQIDRYIVLGKGEEMSGGRQKNAILADAVEAVIGALYLDSGFEKARDFVLRLIVPEIRKVQDDKGNKDYKTILQEYYQKKHRECPVYELVNKTGPDHDRTFMVSVHLGAVCYGPESGKSKKKAEQNAARAACLALGIENEKK